MDQVGKVRKKIENFNLFFLTWPDLILVIDNNDKIIKDHYAMMSLISFLSKKGYRKYDYYLNGMRDLKTYCLNLYDVFSLKNMMVGKMLG